MNSAKGTAPMTTDHRPPWNLNRHAMGTGIYGFEAVPFYPGPLAVTHAGIYAAVGHEDIQTPHGTPFAAPVGHWKINQLYLSDIWGWTLVLTHIDGIGQLCFMHMYDVAVSLDDGLIYPGRLLGHSGGVPGEDPGVTVQASGGAHLHTAYTYGIKQRIKANYGPNAFTSLESHWAYGQQLHEGGPTFQRGRAVVV